MEKCEQCDNWKYSYQRLERRYEELEKDLQRERKKTDDYDSVKQRRDELQRNADRSYDNYVSNPERHRSDDG